MIDRRALLAGLACSAAAHPLVTPVALAEAPGDARLVVIVLRGAMDGLDVLRPVSDPAWAALGRPSDGHDAGFFALHPGLAPLMPLWRAGEMGAVHAVSTPYRDGRSHFDGQDLLEAGGAGQSDGWLNRLVARFPGARARTAFAVGRDALRILEGPAPVAEWAPETRLDLGPQARRLLSLVLKGDPILGPAAEEAMGLADATGDRARGEPPVVALARYAAARLTEETRIAAFSMTGWDTHRGQARAMERNLGDLSQAILALRGGLGPHWGRTAVLAVTEFGRTVRLNGSGGTDHGTGGAMLTAGGALSGGRVVADWPGLAEAALLDGRDLRPTRDMRAHLAWVLRDLFSVETGVLEREVFPGLDMGARSGVVL